MELGREGWAEHSWDGATVLLWASSNLCLGSALLLAGVASEQLQHPSLLQAASPSGTRLLRCMLQLVELLC